MVGPSTAPSSGPITYPRYPHITKSATTGDARNAAVKASKILPADDDFIIQWTIVDPNHVYQIGVTPLGNGFYSGGVFPTAAGLPLMAYQTGLNQSRTHRDNLNRTENSATPSQAGFGSVGTITRVNGLIQHFIDGVLNGPRATWAYTYTGEMEVWFGLYEEGMSITNITINGEGGTWLESYNVDESPAAGTGGSSGTPATWVGNETIAVELLNDGAPRITLPSATDAVRYNVYINDIEYGSYLSGTATVTLATAGSNDVVRIEAIGTDRILTTTGPTVTIDASPPSVSSTYSSIGIDTSTLDLSELGILSQYSTYYQDNALTTVTTTNANFKSVAESAAAGTCIKVSDTNFQVGSISTGTYEVITITNGTKSNPIVIAANTPLQLIRCRIETRGTGHIVFEGFHGDNCGGPHGIVHMMAPGTVMASCKFSNFYSWPTSVDGDATSVGHWCGHFNCEYDFANKYADYVSAFSLKTGTGYPPVGSFMCNFKAINCANTGGQTTKSSIWQADVYEPEPANYLDAKDRFIRVFFGHVVGHTTDDETHSAKFHGMHFHSNLTEGGSSAINGRYCDYFYFTGNLQDSNGGSRVGKVHGDACIMRWNLYFNGANTQGVEMSVEDTDPNSANVDHYYQATTNLVSTDNVFIGAVAFATLIGPQSNSAETVPATGNTIRNVYVTTNGVSLPMDFEQWAGLNGDFPSQDYAQWSIDNPNALETQQDYVQLISGTNYELPSGDITFDWTTQARPRWPNHPDDPMSVFPHIQAASATLMPGAMFESAVSTS